MLTHIPEPRRHLVRYTGPYSNVSRGKRKRLENETVAGRKMPLEGRRAPGRDRSPDARALRRRWAEMIKRVCEVDPMVFPRCQDGICIIALIVDPKVVDRILRHLTAREGHREGGPPGWTDLEAAS